MRLGADHRGTSSFSCPFWARAISLVFIGVPAVACVNKKNREKGELRSISVLSRTEGDLDLLLLKSMGFTSDVRIVQMMTGSRVASAGRETAGFNFYGLNAVVNAANEDAFRKVIPLYGQLAASKVKFSPAAAQLNLSDLMSPAVQAVTGRELRLNDSELNMSSSDALLSVMLAESAQIRFTVQNSANLGNLFLDGLSFKSVGEIPASSKSPSSGKRERNSGFSIGDVLVVFDRNSDSGILHTALWIDHDVYFEAIPLADSIVFRFASYAQVMEELARRVSVDVRQLRMKIVRRAVAWPEIAQRVTQFKEQKTAGSSLIAQDSAGRGQPSSIQGLTLTLLPSTEVARSRATSN
jgi:hypothetical protein